MDENLKEMSLDQVGSKSISEILKEVSKSDDYLEKSSKLEFHVQALEEELRKIDAFRRELPNCMHLLQDAIERLKEEMRREIGPAMEDFILFKSNSEEDARAQVSNDIWEKKNWMSSVQLWTTPVQYENQFVTRNQDPILHLTSRDQEGKCNGIESDIQGPNLNFKKRTGAFVPFKKPSVVTMREDKGTAEGEDKTEGLTQNHDFGFGRTKLHQPHQLEQQRKQRRCWTVELHRRFVDALHQLGGPQIATPKQIREVMGVDGLTNDEVKSHLQKYRIHIRKKPAARSTYPWSSQDQLGEHLLNPMVANCGSPQGSLGLEKSAKVGSGATGGDGIEDEEDEQSVSHDWMSRLQN